MRHPMRTVAAASLLVVSSLWAGVNPAAAEPGDPSADPATPVAEQSLAGPAPEVPLADSIGPNEAVVTACSQFGGALNLAASNYEDFAYASAGGGNYVDYQDPNVWRSNVIGRTALREAAAAALSASRTAGLPQEVSDPMQSWSLRATKLLLIMGVRGGGDSLNSTVNALNTYAQEGQLACSRNGGQA